MPKKEHRVAIGFWENTDSFSLSRVVPDEMTNTDKIADWLCEEAGMNREYMAYLLIAVSDSEIGIECPAIY